MAAPRVDALPAVIKGRLARRKTMCKCLSGRSFEDTLAAGHILTVHYHLYPEQIEAFVMCEHGQVIPFTEYRGSETFNVIYDAVWKERLERPEVID
jgi:hypothetical protein